MASSGIVIAFPPAYLSISAKNERFAPQPIYLSLEIKYRALLKFQLYLRKKNAILPAPYGLALPQSAHFVAVAISADIAVVSSR